jgi:hypothetical protein
MPIFSDRATRWMILRSTEWFPRDLRVRWRYRWLADLEIGKARRGNSIIIGHPKSGNTWLRTMIARAYQVKYGLPAKVALKTDELARRDSRIPRFCVSNGFYSYEGELGRLLKQEIPDAGIAQKPIVLLTRHPADIAVSWYLQFTRRVSAAKRELINASLEQAIAHESISRWDFVMHSAIGLRSIIDFLNDWERCLQRYERTLIVRYEEMRSAPYDTLKKVTDFLGDPFAEGELREAVDFGSFENLRKLEASGFFKYGGLTRRRGGGPESVKVRRGKVGGYREDFTPAQVEEIDALVARRLSPTLGYSAPPAAETAVPAVERNRHGGGSGYSAVALRTASRG